MVREPWVVVSNLIRRPLHWWLRPVVRGAEHIPTAGGVVVAPNHLSYLDIFLVAAASPRAPRFVGKSELARGWLGRLVGWLGMVPVERGHGDLRVVRDVAALLRAGALIGIFPEGTRTPDGRLYRFRSGATRAAAAAQVPLVPATITGTNAVWPKGGKVRLRRPPRGTVSITFHPPLSPPADDGPARRRFTQRLEAVVAGASDQPLADCFAPKD
ncbi:MAG TPA: lysophospholipid acyltransferase family protein [Egibacteraceae bacterium]|nr:lysophospholipid acyltransferase family protein [Egibacteraceae bacterium]